MTATMDYAIIAGMPGIEPGMMPCSNIATNTGPEPVHKPFPAPWKTATDMDICMNVPSPVSATVNARGLFYCVAPGIEPGLLFHKRMFFQLNYATHYVEGDITSDRYGRSARL